jgi:hypothetical protein
MCISIYMCMCVRTGARPCFWLSTPSPDFLSWLWHSRFHPSLLATVPLMSTLGWWFPVKYTLQLSSRYLSKVSRDIGFPRALKHKKTHSPTATELQPLPSNVRIANLLHFDILILVSQYLHYVDLVSLGMTSKAIRKVIFPSANVGNTVEMYRKYSCEGAIKSRCWICNRQICKVCEFSFTSTPHPFMALAGSNRSIFRFPSLLVL